MKINKEYKIGVFSALVGVIFTAIYDFIKSKPVLTTFSQILNWIWKNIFEFKFSIWQILLALIVFSIFRILRNRFQNNKVKDEEKLQDFHNYTEDNIAGYKWRWQWKLNSLKNVWNIKSLAIVCNGCGTLMNLHEDFISENLAECPRCDNRVRGFKSIGKIEAIIVDNINRDLYKKK